MLFFTLNDITSLCLIFRYSFTSLKNRQSQKMDIYNAHASGHRLLSLRGHLVMAASADIFVVTLELVPGIEWAEGRDAAERPRFRKGLYLQNRGYNVLRWNYKRWIRIFYNFRISLFPTNMFCQTEIKVFSLHKGNFLSLNITSTGFNV